MTTGVKVRGLSFAYASGGTLLHEVDMELGVGWTGVVGANGCGKSTLLALLAGRLDPVAGQIEVIPRRACRAICLQEAHAMSDDVATFGRSAHRDAHRLRGRLGLDAAELVRWSTLSPGERKRWQVAAALAAEPDILLLDEPANHLDGSTREWLVRALRPYPGCGVLVAHDAQLLDALCSRTVYLPGDGTARCLPGGWTQASELLAIELATARAEHAERQRAFRIARDAAQKARERLLQAERSRSTRARARNAGDREAGSMGAKFRADRAAAHLAAEARAAKRRSTIATETHEACRLPDDHRGSVAFAWEQPPHARLLGATFAPLRAEARVLAERVTIDIGRSARIRVEGPNGAGKSTLLRSIAAQWRHAPSRIFVLPQELTPAEVHNLIAEANRLPSARRGRLAGILARLGSAGQGPLTSQRPSPGEARKLALALGLLDSPWLLVLDEPTNHLDPHSIDVLADALADWPGALLYVTHTERFADRLGGESLRLPGWR